MKKIKKRSSDLLRLVRQQAEDPDKSTGSFYEAIDYLVRTGQDYKVRELLENYDLSNNARDNILDALFESGYRLYFQTKLGYSVAIPFAIVLNFLVDGGFLSAIPSDIAGLVDELSEKRILRKIFRLSEDVDVMVDSSLYRPDDQAWLSPSTVRNYLSAVIEYMYNHSGPQKLLELVSPVPDSTPDRRLEIVYCPRVLVGVAVLHDVDLYEKVEESLFEKETDCTELESTITSYINKENTIVESLFALNCATELIDVPYLVHRLATEIEIEQQFNIALDNLLMGAKPGVAFNPKVYVLFGKNGFTDTVEIIAYANSDDKKPFFYHIHKVDYDLESPDLMVETAESLAKKLGAKLFVLKKPVLQL